MPRRKQELEHEVAEAEAVDVVPKAITDLASTASVPAPASDALARPKRAASRLRPVVQFPLVVVLNFALSSLGYSYISQWSGSKLVSVAKFSDTQTEQVILAGWKLCELALAWYASYDGYDLAALNLLSRGPTLYLLTSFYEVEPLTAAACLSVDVLSSFLPFVLLRPLSGAHSAASTVANRELIVDRTIFAYTTLLAGAIYSVTLSMAYNTFLPKTLVLYFEGIPTVEPAHSATKFLFVSVPAAALSVLFGVAARTFIFTPITTTGPSPEDNDIFAFDPVTANLKETMEWNLWGYTAQAKVAIQRTAVVMALTGVTTYLQCALTVEGVEPYGAAVYASVWVLAAFLTGIGLGVVGRA